MCTVLKNKIIFHLNKIFTLLPAEISSTIQGIVEPPMPTSLLTVKLLLNSPE